MSNDQEELKSYVQQSMPRFERGIALIQDMTGWTRIGEASGSVTCHRRPNTETGFDIFKAEVYYDRQPKLVGRYLFDNWGKLSLELQPDDVAKFDRVKDFNDDARIGYSASKARGPVSAREGVIFTTWLSFGEETYAIISHSIDSDIPVAPNHIRGDMQLVLHLFEPLAGDATKTCHQSIFIADPKGLIPAAAANVILSNRKKFYEQIREKVHQVISN